MSTLISYYNPTHTCNTTSFTHAYWSCGLLNMASSSEKDLVSSKGEVMVTPKMQNLKASAKLWEWWEREASYRNEDSDDMALVKQHNFIVLVIDSAWKEHRDRGS
ncbi:hypothetical protein GOBAR_DD22873 [Gossypium barbadense]|nr:hypothetical protein GOBAR_DD22873 [Gossypium barbadense]